MQALQNDYLFKNPFSEGIITDSGVFALSAKGGDDHDELSYS